MLRFVFVNALQLSCLSSVFPEAKSIQLQFVLKAQKIKIVVNRLYYYVWLIDITLFHLNFCDYQTKTCTVWDCV